jgi:ribosomal protein L19E
MTCSRQEGAISVLVLLLGFSLPAEAIEAGRGIGLGQGQEQTRSQSPAQSQKQGESRIQAQEKAASQCEPKPGSSVVICPPSLGQIARQQRAERDNSSNPPPRVFTNDNLPKSSGGLSIIGPPPGEKNAFAKAMNETHAAGVLHRRVADLRQQLETHQRELAVLQQKLGENEVQYYPNPNDTLHQEYSREDINRLTLAIDQKKKQIDADQQALSDAEDELARQGLAPAAPETGDESLPPSKPDLSGVPKGSEQYWRLRFKAAREALAKAQEQQKLAEDEFALLQSQQAHEIASGGAAAFDPQISAKQAEVESKRAAAAQAQRDLDSVEQEFKQSGAPQSWSE